MSPFEISLARDLESFVVVACRINVIAKDLDGPPPLTFPVIGVPEMFHG